jgi:hypothetical protein
MVPATLPRSLCTLLALYLAAGTARAQSHLVRLSSIQDDPVGAIAAASLGDERLVTAVVNAAGNLQLATWDVTADGKFTRRGVIGAGAASVFAVAGLGSGRIVTPVRKEDGGLRLITWAVGPDGGITRLAHLDAGPIERVSIAVGGPSRVITAVVNAGHTKLIVWDVSRGGQLTRRGDHSGPDGSRAAVAALSASRLMLAVRGTDGKLDVSSWSLDPAGAIAPLKSVKGGAISETAITSAALDRAVTASTLSDGTLEVAAWDVATADGTVTARGAGKAGVANHVTIAALSSAKVVTSLRQSDKTLKLITWHVVDKVTRLDSIAAGEISDVAAATLGWDRAIAAIRDSTGRLKLIDYADFSVGLLHSSWGPTATVHYIATFPLAVGVQPQLRVDDEQLVPPAREVEATPPKRFLAQQTEPAEALAVGAQPGPIGPQVQSPPPALVFFPNISGVDPMIAVGKEYVVVSQDHWIEFLYKTGNKAGAQLDSKAGEKTRLSSYEFFGGFFAEQNKDGTVNRHNVNLHLRFPPSFDPAVSCSAPYSAAPCMNEAYDTQVVYDPYRGRFVIMSHIRGVGLSGATTLVARRYVAIAISRTEDPRDGFHQFMTTESNYSDRPRIASGDGVLVVAHNACKGPDAIDTCGPDHQVHAGNTMALRPMAYVYRTDDLIANQLAPRNWKIYPYAVDGGTFYPVTHQGATDGWTYLVKPTSGLDIYAFKQPLNHWTAIPSLQKSSITLAGGAKGFTESLHFRAGRLHLGGAVLVTDRVPNVAPARWHTRGVRIPISTTAGLKAGPCPATPGCLDFDFGLRALEDAPGDKLSYDMASLAPDASGNMVLVYGRVPVTMTKPIGQEARFSIYYNDSRGLMRSRLIHAGGVVLKDFYCAGGVTESTATAENFWHVWYATTGCQSQKHFQDYATAAVDPDGKSFWVVHAYADAGTNTFKMVGAKVVP